MISNLSNVTWKRHLDISDQAETKQYIAQEETTSQIKGVSGKGKALRFAALPKAEQGVINLVHHSAKSADLDPLPPAPAN